MNMGIIGPKSQLVQAWALHGSPGMHDKLRGGSPDVAAAWHPSIATEPGTNRLAHAFQHHLDPERGRMSEPNGEPIYARLGTINHLMLEHAAVILEGQNPDTSNFEGVAFASGMGAIAASVETQVAAGEEVIFHMPVYGCTNRLAKTLMNREGRLVQFANFNDLSQLRKMISDRTVLLYGETLTNPTIRAMNLPGVAQLVEDVNKSRSEKPLAFGVDNTFLTPIGLRPLDHGADWVVHSGSKYISAYMQHTIGMAIAPQEMVFSGEEGLIAYRDHKGGVLDSFAAHQVFTTGISTLLMRTKWMEQAARPIAEFLEESNFVDTVYYPGLESYPDRAISRPIFRDYDGEQYDGSMIYFELPGDFATAKNRGYRFMQFLEKKGHATTVAVSLGAIFTLIEHPATMTHAAYSEEELKAAGMGSGGIRIAVGTEGPAVLIPEIKAALEFAFSDRSIESLDEKPARVRTEA